MNLGMRHSLFFIVAVLLMPLIARADCSQYFEKWAADLKSGSAVDLANAACKIWPLDPSLTIAVLPYPLESNSHDAGAYDLEVLLANSATGAVIAHVFQPSEIIYDAVRFSGIEIDTARYQLMPNRHAFGVRISYSGSSSIFPFDTTSLNLYVPDASDLHPVLNRFVVKSKNGDWDSVCQGVFNTTLRTIEIGSARVGEYSALKVVERNSRSANRVSGSDCLTEIQSIKHANYVLKYRNGHYPVPTKLTLKF